VTGKTTADTAFSTNPQSAEELIHELVRRQWAMVCIGRKTAPAAIAAYHRNNHQADVIMQREQILALIANRTDAEQRIRVIVLALCRSLYSRELRRWMWHAPSATGHEMNSK
jgi:hypothetical protein